MYCGEIIVLQKQLDHVSRIKVSVCTLLFSQLEKVCETTNWMQIQGEDVAMLFLSHEYSQNNTLKRSVTPSYTLLADVPRLWAQDSTGWWNIDSGAPHIASSAARHVICKEKCAVKKKHCWGLFPVTDGTSGAQTAFAHLNPAGNQFKVCRSYRRTSFTDCYTLAHMHGHAHVTAQHCQLLRRHIRSEVINHERVRAVGLV